MIRPIPAVLAAACLPLLVVSGTLAQQPVEAPLADRVPPLAEQSSWAMDVSASDAAARRGCYAIGNGRVFAWCGTGAMANELEGITGPRYQTDEDAVSPFGSLLVELRGADGATVELPRQRVRQVSGAAVVVTEDASDGIALRTTTFAPPDGTTILRVVEVANLGGSAQSGLRVLVRAADAALEGDRLVARHGHGGRAAVAAIALASGAPGDGGLVADVGDLAPGATWRTAIEIRTDAGHEPGATAPSVDSAAAALQQTVDAWRDRLASTMQFDSDHEKLGDLVEDWKVRLLVLRDAESGVFVPAQHRRVASVLENNGALIAALRLGLWDEARGVLEFWWNATRLLGAVPDEVRLDLDFSAIDAERTAATEFWQEVEVPRGGAASFVLLQHLWYWRTTGDTALIERHWPLIDVCLKRQRRGPDEMMQFSGNESWLRLARKLGEDAADPALFVSEDPALDRRSWSFENSVLFLMCVQAVGELVDGVDELHHPERWEGGPPDKRPSAAYSRRSFDVMKALEKRFWIEDAGYFAPAVSPVDEQQHAEPIAEANLLPLWVGWTFPTGEKSRDNLRNSLARLWRDGARLGSTPTVGHATGDLQGRLLTALSERDGRRRLDVIDAVLASAEPAGEWPSFVDPRGNAFGHERLSPGVGGTNLDALLFAITGIRHASVPNWDDDDIRLELRLPHGAEYVTIRGTRKDERELNLFFRRERAMLSEEEMKANDELKPEKRRDPTVPHDRLRFVVELVEGRPTKGYYDVGLNAEGTMFVRYLQPTAPADPEQPDLRKIEEMEFSTPDSLDFLPEGLPAGPGEIRRQVARAEEPELLVLTCRPVTATTMQAAGVTVFDTGLPFGDADLRGELLGEDGKPVHRRVFLDWGFDAPPPGVWTRADWFASDAWTELLAAYRSAGGEVTEPGFVREVEWATAGDEWRTADVQDDGAIALPAEAARARVKLTGENARDVVLRLGASCPVVVEREGGDSVLEHGGSPVATPDASAALLSIPAGGETLVLRLEGSGERKLYLRLTDAQGLPTGE